MNGIEIAVQVAGGTPAQLAKAAGHGITRQLVEHWLKAGKVPAAKAPDVAAVTGVSVDELCPGVRWDVVRKMIEK